jgi:hypothetical protein
MLLEHGAFVSVHGRVFPFKSSINILLCRHQESPNVKLAICRILVQHAKEDYATAAFLQASFKFAMKLDDNVWPRQFLLHAGIDKRITLYSAIEAENLDTCQLLVTVYCVDPFKQEKDEIDHDDGNETAAASPFLAAARLSTIFEYLLGLWNERFASNDGKNSDGDYPLHVVCCDPLVSLQAITMLVKRHADAVATVDGEQGLLPFHFAANWGASLDVIFYLLPTPCVMVEMMLELLLVMLLQLRLVWVEALLLCRIPVQATLLLE